MDDGFRLESIDILIKFAFSEISISDDLKGIFIRR